MNIHKLFRPHNSEEKVSEMCMAQIYSDNYNCSLKHIQMLADTLKRDFPGMINDEDIQVQKFGGNRLKGITFVEATLPKYTIMPDGYTKISQLEYIL